MASLEPSTSVEVAAAADLNERYVREWLASMTVSGLNIHDPVRKTFALPEVHAACLTRDAGMGNLAALMQFIAVLAAAESDIVRCFRDGGGLPYSAFQHPLAPFLYCISCMHCMTVPLSAGGAGLGTMWGEGLGTLLRASEFDIF